MSDLTFIGYDPDHAKEAAAAIPAAAIHPLDVRVMHEELRRECKGRKIGFGVAWAQIWLECGGFVEADSEWARRKNPAGIKSESGGAFMRYYNGVDSARGYLSHLSAYMPGYAEFSGLRNTTLDPRFPVANALAKAVDRSRRPLLASVAKFWAEDKKYEQKVAEIYARLFSDEAAWLPVLIVAGHRNTDGGNPTERGWTDDLARAYLAAARAGGMRAEWLQEIDRDTDPDDTLADLWNVATLCNEWLARQRAGGIMLDLHFEGGGSPGVFAIYPDAAGDSGNTIDIAYAGTISRRIADAVGLDVRRSGVVSPGVMSERQTGVGARGFRLGMFNLTAGQREKCIRLVIEHGSHDKNPDRARIDALGITEYARRAAIGAVTALKAAQG